MTHAAYSYSDLIAEYRLMHDSGDAWGSVMEWLFAIAGELWERDPYCIPSNWEYRPSPISAKDPNGYLDNSEIITNADIYALIDFGCVLYRYSRMLKAAGRSY